MEMSLSVFRAYGEDAVAASLLAALAAVTGIPFKGAHYWPSVTDPGRLVTRWDEVCEKVLVPYFAARAAHANMLPSTEDQVTTQEPEEEAAIHA